MNNDNSEDLFGAALSRSLNAAYASANLPHDFSDRLAAVVASRGRTHTRRKRWVTFAAFEGSRAGSSSFAHMAALGSSTRTTLR